MLKITFNLDKTFKPGTSMAEVSKLKAQGKSIAKFFNPKETPIYLWVSPPGFKHFKVHTGLMILPIHWDFYSKKAKASYTNCIKLNIRLSKIDDYIQGEVLKYEINGDHLHYEDIQRIVKEAITENKPKVETKDFLTLIDEFIEDRKHEIKPHTQTKYKSVRSMLEKYKETQSFAFTLSRIDFEFEKSFKNHMLKKKMSTNTISKYVECVKVVMRWARMKGYHNDNRFENFTAPRVKTEKSALTLEEFKSLLNLEIDYKKEKSLAHVRDRFCVQLLSGQRFSDIGAMKWRDIINKDGVMIWKLFQQKHNKPNSITIPLLPWLVNILDRYKKENLNERVFPNISNGEMNRILKVLSERANITSEFSTMRFSGTNRISLEGKKCDFITTHTARRSFVTIAMELGMETQAIMRITGHTKYDVMQGYMRMDDSYQIRNFQNTWGKLDLTSETKQNTAQD